MFTKYSPVCLCAILAVVSAYPYTTPAPTYAPIEQEHLTGWFNRDSPTGKGDFETLDEIRQENPHLLCAFPFGIECQTTTGDAYTATGQIVKCEASTGLICLNADQPAGSQCLDYRVRFRCSHPIDECASNPCQNNGVCRDRTNAFVCVCPVGFEGERCEININDCAPNPCLNGGQCFDLISDYICLCPDGYNGRYCETDINDCIGHRCENGAMCRDLVDGYVCLCATGYEGLFCDYNTDDCAPQPCLNNGMCQDLNNGYKCWCPPGYSGNNCGTDINECDPNPCQQGTCVDGINSFTCACNAGFRGDICQTNEDDCTPNPCIYGSCVDGFGVYFCACLPGYGGTNCDINIDDCSFDACMNGGTCSDAVNGYTCTCPPGYTGPICEIDINECIPDPCQNNGICVNSVNAYFCICQPGYTGLRCETDVDDCAGDPCRNGATCVDLVGNYRCDCVLGYAGDLCEVSINECATYPCLNGATCQDYVGYYTCVCRPGYTGYNCEINVDECKPNPCLNGALCLDKINGYKCVCINGYTGVNCEVDIDECRSGPCLNGATCDQKPNGGYKCTCVPGYTGDRCETDINECASDPCEYGATCVDLQNSFWCNCVPGYEGITCGQEIDECYSQPCQNGATCTDLVNSYRCTCYPGYEGPNCEISVNECDRIPCQNNGVCLNTGSGTYQCICSPEWFGDDCQYAQDMFCDHKADGLYSHWVLCSSYISCSNSKTYIKKCTTGLVFNAAGYCDWPYNVPSCDSQQTSTCSGRLDGLYVDPDNCGQYIQCGGGIEYIMLCPSGLVFNENTMKCDYPQNVPRCAAQQQVDPFCTGKPDGFYRHPTDCTIYYICSFGSLQIANCFYNLVYNEDLKRCDFPSKTPECNQAQTGDVYCSGKQDGNYEYPGECAKFVQCSGGVSTVSTCLPGLVYCIENDRCDYPPTTGRCAQAGQIGDFCDTKSAVGLYRDPSDCEKFYQCSNGNTYHHSCPAGLVYNEAVGKCDYYANVPGCGQPQIVFDPFCWDRSDGLYQDPSNCNMYYKCSNKLASHFACPQGQAFDEIQVTCNMEKYLSGCNTNGGQQPQYQQDEECLALNGYFPDNNYCKGYFVCVLGVATRLECEGNLVFNPDTKKCDSVYNVPQCRQEDPLCVDRPNGRYPYPGYCTKFLVCQNGYSDVIICTTGLAYNAEAQDCQAPENTPSCFCVGRSGGSYADPTSCYQYYSCMNGVTLRPNCSPGLTYNAAIGTCDSSPNTGPPQCTYQQQQQPDPLCAGKPNGAYGFDDVCNKYYVCSAQKSTVAVCVAGTVYNPAVETCSLPTEVSGRCGVQPVVVDAFCKYKSNGHYEHPTDCNKFYQCFQGTTYRKECQHGLVFNLNKLICDWPANVPQCNNP